MRVIDRCLNPEDDGSAMHHICVIYIAVESQDAVLAVLESPALLRRQLGRCLSPQALLSKPYIGPARRQREEGMQRRGQMLSRVSPRLHGRLHVVEPISIMYGGCRISACVDSKFPTFAAPAGPGIVPGHEYAYRTVLCNAPTAHPRFYAPCAGDGGTFFCGPFVDIARNLSCHQRSCFGTLAPCCLLSDNAVTTTT